MYHQHVQRWLEVFSRDQLLVVNGDQLIEDPLSQVKRIETFLGEYSYLILIDYTQLTHNIDGYVRSQRDTLLSMLSVSDGRHSSRFDMQTWRTCSSILNITHSSQKKIEMTKRKLFQFIFANKETQQQKCIFSNRYVKVSLSCLAISCERGDSVIVIQNIHRFIEFLHIIEARSQVAELIFFFHWAQSAT